MMEKRDKRRARVGRSDAARMIPGGVGVPHRCKTRTARSRATGGSRAAYHILLIGIHTVCLSVSYHIASSS
jgi:hypothetical protein